MKHTTQALTAMIVTALCAVFVTGFAQASTIPLQRQEITYQAVRDLPEPEPEGMTRIVAWQQEREEAQQAQQEAEEAAASEQYEYEPEYTYYEDYSGYQAASYTGDGFQQQGVRYHDGRTETWYSSNQAYHHRTSEWTVDDEGYYRDGDGHYVVAASDMPEGTVFETSKGEAIVLDNGCDAGVTDFYTAF